MKLIDQIATEANFNAAWNKVRINFGAPGIDRVSVEEFEKNLPDNLGLLLEMVQQGSYEPLPYKDFTYKKNSGKDRKLHIPTVRDRIVQQAILFVIQPIYEKIFLNCSYAYRPGKSAQKAIDRVERNLKRSRKWVLNGDVQNFFDEIDRQLLLKTLAETIKENALLKLIEKCIYARESANYKGIPQGMVIAPILSNIYLHDMDDRMMRTRWQYIRYSDNILILDSSEQQVKLALERAEKCLHDVKLKFNSDKTEICNLTKGFVFLGFQFDERGKRPAEPAIRRIEQRIGKVLHNASEYSQSQLKEKLESIVRGWLNYFKIHETDKQKLMTRIEQNFSDQTDSIPQRILRAALAFQLGDRSRAQSILRSSPIIDSSDAEINYQWGVLCDLLDLKSEAVDSFLAAFRLNTEHPDAGYRIGLHYLQTHQFEQAVRYLQKAVQLNPQNPAVHLALGTALQQFSMNGAAQRSFKKAIYLDPGVKKYLDKVPVEKLQQGAVSALSYTKQDIPYFLHLFPGREGVFSRQWLNDEGKMGYMPVYHPLTENDIETHLQGKETLGIYLMRSDNTVMQMAYDIDIIKQVRNEIITDKREIKDWKQFIWNDVLKIHQLLKDVGIQAYPEDSGYKGMHLWIFFSVPQPARDVIVLAKKILAVAGAPPVGIHREIFPRESRVSPKALGSMIKLPLGIHKLTGRRCPFLDISGQPVADQLGLVRNIVKITDNTFKSALEKLKSPADIQSKKEPRANTTEVDKIVKGCNVIRYLMKKSEKEKMLNHTDRLTILNVLVHLGKAGQQTIHEVMNHTLNYSFRITERWIQRKRGFPVSCPKIREWQSHITPSVGCYCKFKEMPNSYPSPVLHADPEFIIKIKTKQQSSPQPKSQPLRQDKISKPEKAEVFRDSAAPSESSNQLESTEKTERKPVAIADINKLFQNYVKHKKDQRELVQKITDIEAQLNQLCQQQNTHQFVTEFGVFKRVKEGNLFKWMIEI